MKVVGIIVEYNPFHNGHLYHLKEAKRITGADYVIAIMSGDFLQRGTPALIDKYTRTQMAIRNGVDLVIELPTYYSTASAEYFARGAVELLNKLNVVDAICFGSECGNIPLLTEIAKVLVTPSKSLDAIIKSNVKKGLTYPIARSQAIIDLFLDKYSKIELESIMNHPNNILSIEYMKALIRSKSKIKPYVITRIESGYHDVTMTRNIVSATAIRNFLALKGNVSELESKVPNSTFEQMNHCYNRSFPIFQDDFSLLLNYKINSTSKDELLSYLDVSSDIYYRLMSSKGIYTFSELAENIKAKHLTLTRIQRGLLHILLDIKAEVMNSYRDHDWIGYGRALGFSINSTELLAHIKKHSSIPLITKVGAGLASLEPIWADMLTNTINASKTYNLIVWNKYSTRLQNDYESKIIKL